MGGSTFIYLKNQSETNIKRQNDLLKKFGVPKKFRFYSEADTMAEYVAFINGKGTFPEHMFPRHLINSYEEFKSFWNPKVIGEIFCPYTGSLWFDCYYGRTSKKAMYALGRYFEQNHEEIERVTGSFSTFVERGPSKRAIEAIKNSEIKGINW